MRRQGVSLRSHRIGPGIGFLFLLGAINNVQAVRLDVTRPEEIGAAVQTVIKGGRGLYGLVNNACVVTGGPLILARKGRIINIGSISAILNEAEWGAYQMSKHPMETFTDTLAQELAPSGVWVSVVEPGSYKSDIFKNKVKRSGSGAQYADDWAKLKEPDDVAAAVELALFEPQSKRRYMVVPDRSRQK